MDKPRSLTPKQAAFVAEYLIDLNATRAAIRAGYSERTAAEVGYQLLQKTSVSTAIAEGKKTRADRLGLDSYWVLERLKRASDRCMDEFDFNPSGAIRAAELIGKHLGMFEESVKVTHSGSVEVSLTPEQMKRIAQTYLED